MHGVVGTDQEIGTDFRELICGGEHQLTYTLPVVTVDASHVLGERVRVHRDLGMIVRAEKLHAFYADGPITKSCAFGGAGNNTDVAGHYFFFQTMALWMYLTDVKNRSKIAILNFFLLETGRQQAISSFL